MVLNILFIREFYHRNRKFWYPLYAFHIGIYLLILWHAWLFITAVVTNIETASNFGWIWETFTTTLTFLGGIGILLMRMIDLDLKVYYPPGPLSKMSAHPPHPHRRCFCSRHSFPLPCAWTPEVCERTGDFSEF